MGQTATITGTVMNKDENVAIPNAVVALISPADSILQKFTRTDQSGKFTLKNVPYGKYIFMTSQPRFGDLLDEINVQGDAALPSIFLISKATLLKEVVINTGTPIRVKGDTTIYTADSFVVSANANVEELLKKLPGIQVDKDGKITAMGETVQKVLVDGEEFFGDDPGMAVKNLRADAVKEVQVFDKKSDQAEFTGIDDGNTAKTINLKLKENAKKGYFGKVDMAAGPLKNKDTRYNGNLMASSFKGSRKFSAFLLNGNTGQDGLGWEDEQKYSGFDNVEISDDGGMMIFMGGSSDDEPYVDTRNGFITNTNAGIQYNNKWKDMYSLNLAPRYNEQRHLSNVKSYSETAIGDSVLYANSLSTANTARKNFKLKGIVDIKIDSMNTVKITANRNFYETNSQAVSSSATTGAENTLKNSSDKTVRTSNDKQAFSGTILWKHKFKKQRRTLSVSTNWGSINTEGISFLNSKNKSYIEGALAKTILQDQRKDFDLANRNLSANIVYTEPLTEKYSLEVNYALKHNGGHSNQIVYAPDANGKYEYQIDSLSNEFKLNILEHQPGTKLVYNSKKLKLNAGASFGITDFNLTDMTMSKDYNRDYINFYPSANLTYTYKSNQNIRINYNGRSNQPSINELQPLRNNDTYFYQVLGNPDLKPSFTNSLDVFNNTYNFISGFWSYQSIGFSFTNNQIVSNRVTDLESGKTVSRPENLDGNFSLYLNSYFSFKMKKADLQIGFGPGFSVFKNPVMINNQKYFAQGYTPGMSFTVSKGKEKKYAFVLQDNFSYVFNSTIAASQTRLKTDYASNRLNTELALYAKKVWQLVLNFENRYQGKTTRTDKGLSVNLFNARLQRTFHHDQFTIYISGNDLLNQNQGIDRSFYNGNYSEVIQDRLKRYFMLGFRWDFKNKSATSKAGE